MRRFFVSELGSVGERLALPSSVRRHVAVLRLELGVEILLFDGSGRQARARLEKDDETVTATVLAIETLAIETLTIEAVTIEELAHVVLVQAIPKGTKSDDIVRMATELGAHAIHFALTDHAVSRPDDARGSKKVTRWQRIAEEAARQCERVTVPEVHAPAPLAEVCARAPSDAIRLVAWARGGRLLADVMTEVMTDAITDAITEASSHAAAHPAPNPTRETHPVRETWIAIGPEGGFSDPELEAFDRGGFVRVTLGPHVLRVDTAALAALAQLTALAR